MNEPFEVILYGHAFPSPENDNKCYVPVWKQKVFEKKGEEEAVFYSYPVG